MTTIDGAVVDVASRRRIRAVALLPTAIFAGCSGLFGADEPGASGRYFGRRPGCFECFSAELVENRIFCKTLHVALFILDALYML
jgi:hypothetical protein